MSKHIEFMETSELKQLAKDLYMAVEVEECFSAKDVLRLQLAEKELDRRGISMHTNTEVYFMQMILDDQPGKPPLHK